MLHFVIAEDIPAERELLAQYLTRFFSEHGEEPELTLFSSGEELLDHVPFEADAVFLDIEMGDLNGMETAKCLRQTAPDVPLLFVTNLARFALEGYEVNAADFIIKPLEYNSLALRLERLSRRLERGRDRFLMVKQGTQTLRCNIRDLLYIEALNKRTILHRLEGEPLTCSDPLYTLERSLGSGFFRCHNAFLVNLDHIDALSTTEVTLHGKQVPISKYRKKEFLAALANHRGRLM